MQQSQQSFSPSFIGEYGAEGFSGQGFSYGASFRGDQNQSLGPGQAPGIGFTPSPGSGPSGPPNTNFNNIHIPPGAHAPANTPAELPPPTGTQHRDSVCIDAMLLPAGLNSTLVHWFCPKWSMDMSNCQRPWGRAQNSLDSLHSPFGLGTPRKLELFCVEEPFLTSCHHNLVPIHQRTQGWMDPVKKFWLECWCICYDGTG